MSAVFADSFYFLALLSDRDQAHSRAVHFSEAGARPMVTTAWVLTEVADAFADQKNRRAFLRLLSELQTSADARIVPPSPELFSRGIELYARRLDKAWSLTDCISFVVMADEGLAEALTGDSHFEQAGFEALMK